MSQDSQDFEQLRRLLVLKRYEQPPPGYLHSFSREVIVRIRAGELGERETKWWAFDGSWLKWVWSACERRPVLAGGAGAAFCGFVVAATLISGSGEVPDGPITQNLPVNHQYVAAQNGLTAETLPMTAPVDVLYTDFPGLAHRDADALGQSSFFAPRSGAFQWQQPVVQSASFTPGN